MYSLFKKELILFFSSLVAYIIIGVFLLINFWFLWINKGPLNIFDSAYAGLDTLFFIAPWVFLFLVPALTMRCFAEEHKTGTIDLLRSLPLSTTQLILAKYCATLCLIIIALLPCLISFASVYYLGQPVGNLDLGGTWGSFIGLFLLSSTYAAVGLFASSFTDNQVVAFIASAGICLFLYLGFDGLAELPVFSSLNTFWVSLGINDHYTSISRGVVDLRDLLYFVSLSLLFLAAARLLLQAKCWS